MNLIENEVVIEKLKIISKKYNLSLLILFGSRATGKWKNTSDFDFAFISKNLSTDDEINLFNEIMAILQTEKIDLINISKNHDVKLRNEIFSKGKMIYENSPSLFSDLKSKAWIDYMDFKKFTDNDLSLINKDIRELKV